MYNAKHLSSVLFVFHYIILNKKFEFYKTYKLLINFIFLFLMTHYFFVFRSVVPIVVYESEPSSIIAYALDSHDYKHSLQEQLRGTKGPELNPSPLIRRKLLENKENTSDLNQSNELKRPSVLSFLRGNSPNPNTLVRFYT